VPCTLYGGTSSIGVLIRVRGRLRGILTLLWRYFLEARPVVQGIFLLRFLTGASFASPVPALATSPELWFGAALWGCTMSSVYVLNGVMDIEEDRVNRSARPVARGDLTRTQAAGATAAFAVLGVAGGSLLEPALALNAGAVLLLGWLYSGPPLFLKRWPVGLAGVAGLGGVITYHAGYSVGGRAGGALDLVLFAGVMALWMGLVGQTKDLSDVEGDREAGRRSGPVAWGEGTARAFYSAAALVLGVTYLAGAALAARELLVSAVVLMVGALTVAATSLGPWGRGERYARRRPYRAFMLAQYGVHLAVVTL